MPKLEKKRADSRSVEKAPGSKAIDRDRPGRWPGIIIISVVLAAILVVVGIFYYQEYVAPFRRTIITVDSITIDMDYFLKRTRLAAADPMAMLEVLTNEQIIKIGAPRYGIEISPEDINQELKRMARGGSGNITDSEVREWYRQRLNEIRLSDSEYKEIMRTSLLAAHLQEYLAERVPTVAEQVYLHGILAETYEEAEEIKARLEAGEDFAGLAREVSLDIQSREKGGELGWVPRGVMELVDYVAFDLSIGEVSTPWLIEEEGGFYLLMVSEKADAREVDEDYLQVLRSKALQQWLQEEMQFHEIKYNFNSEIYAWLNWQMSKK